jgi:23S rRNA (cytosine1962-C5)-methyltransferase
MIELQMKSGREKSLERRHPWIFSGAILGANGEPANGDVVDVVSGRGDWLGRGLYSATSQISVRILTFDRDETIDAAFFQRRLEAAWRRRNGRWDPKNHNAVRWVHGEGDGLPGLVVDRYADVVSIQVQTAGMDRWKDAIVDAIAALAPGCAIYERSDTGVRVLEGLEEVTGPLRGALPEDDVVVRANGIEWAVDVEGGHKTGCYLDQVDNWALVGAQAKGRRVLDTFCFHGGFAMACLRGGAEHVFALDSSQDALQGLEADLARNALAEAPCERLCADVFTALRGFRDRRMSFDMVILDPPKFADSKGHVDKACRAYKDINLLAFKLLNPGGLLATFSCSGAVTPELFQKVVADAALDAKREARMIARYTQAPDHPVSLACPEGLYLKGILVGV